MSEHTLAVRGLTVQLGGNDVLSGLTFEVPAGSSVAVLGPNGAGKTTLFKAVLGLVPSSEGSIEAGTTKLAYVPQRLDIEPSFPITVADVADMGRYADVGWVRRFSDRDRELVSESLRRLDISELANRRFGSLSGGERQRALLAQACAQDAELLMLDEPYAGLDVPTRDALRELIAEWRTEGRTVLVATHDLEGALHDFDLILCLNREQIAFGPPSSCTEEVLAKTFAGRIVRVGELLVDIEHHHRDSG